MAMPTIEEIVCRYLFNQPTPPVDLKDESLIRSAGDKGGAIKVDANEFMTMGGGRFVSVGRFNFVRNFLSGKDKDEYRKGVDLPAGIYTTDELLKAYGIQNNLSASQYYQGIYNSDYAERAYVFGSCDYRINEDAVFYVGEDGSRRISNICVEPVDDNFDYESTDFIARITNWLTEDQIDPSDIGRTVPIEFEGTVTARDSFTQEDLAELELHNNEAEYAELLNETELANNAPYFINLFKSVLDRLLADGIITYEDSEGRYVVYDGKDVSNNGTIHPEILMNNITSWQFPYKGVVVLGGDGNDMLYGTEYSVHPDGSPNPYLYLENGQEKLVLSATGYAPEDGTAPGDNADAQDILLGTGNNDIILGLGGNDGITGRGGDDTIDGGAGNDLIYGGGGADVIYGGADNGAHPANNAVWRTAA